MNRLAFTLVELSIVLVIIGLLVGGVLSGQSLIRASELRAVTTEAQRYLTASYAFRDKYFAIPGDMTNATSFWGKSTTYCTSASGAAATPGTCNGNGNGQIEFAGAASSTGEVFQFWNQLALAGLIEGSYTGASGSGGLNDSRPGSSVPKSKMSNASWLVAFNVSTYGGSATSYALDYGNYLQVGAVVTNDAPYGPLLKPEENWNIDVKMDDGKPGTGKVIAAYWNNACATGGASAADTANSVYNLSNTTAQCAPYFIKLF